MHRKAINDLSETRGRLVTALADYEEAYVSIDQHVQRMREASKKLKKALQDVDEIIAGIDERNA